MSPYNPRASAKISIKIIPTKILSHYALALTPASISHNKDKKIISL